MIPLIPAAAAILATPFLLGAAGTLFFGRAAGKRVPGLLFHSLDLPGTFSLSAISTAGFEKIIAFLSENRFQSLTLGQSGLPHPHGNTASGGMHPVHVTFDDGCRSFYTRALPVLERFYFKTTVFPVAAYVGKTSSWDVLPKFPHLTAQEIREISDLGHEIGSHGLSHTNLAWLGTADLKTELSDSKKILEDITGKKVSSLSFPFGSWNQRVWDFAQEAGYTRGTVYRGCAGNRPGLVPVFGVYRFDTPEFVLTRIMPAFPFSLSVACARIMSHFAKGAPLWKFRKSYRLFPELKGMENHGQR